VRKEEENHPERSFYENRRNQTLKKTELLSGINLYESVSKDEKSIRITTFLLPSLNFSSQVLITK
jgi:hypothetical protein